MALELKNRIMKRVYAIWFFKKIAPIVFLELPLLALIALRETAREFFVAKIVENFSISLQSGIGATIGYFTSALINAPIAPILIILFSLGLFVYLAQRLLRSLKAINTAKLARSY